VEIGGKVSREFSTVPENVYNVEKFLLGCAEFCGNPGNALFPHRGMWKLILLKSGAKTYLKAAF